MLRPIAFDNTERSLNAGVVSLTANSTTDFQCHRALPIFNILRGDTSGTRRGDTCHIRRIRGSIRFGTEQIGLNFRRIQKPTELIAQDLTVISNKIGIVGNEQTMSSSGFQWEFVAPVPTDASGTGLQTPLSSTTTTWTPSLRLSSLGAAPHCTVNGTIRPNANFSGDSVVYTPVWEPVYHETVRFILIRGNYILQPTPTLSSFFEKKSIRPLHNMQSGTNQSHVTVNSFFTRDAYDEFEVLMDVKKENKTGYVDFEFEYDEEFPIKFIEGATSPQWLFFDPGSLTLRQPMRNNVILLVYCSPLSYMYQGNANLPPNYNYYASNHTLEYNFETIYDM